ncbi:MarR family winged helix-turn-helix transcriptional regulator [Sphingomonas sp.]|uniref:MarR family winged helix-turn-helix transcriptional regulator n=1 Tax=Sphingomonas sp. TaxID=28214 RepID=UPI0035C82624
MSREDEAEKALKKLDRIFSTIRSSIGESISLQVAHTFVLVCRNEGLGVVELAERAGASKGTMSRHLLDLSERLRNGQDGYGLLQRTQDPSSLRSIIYTLTPKGKLLKNQLVDNIED